MRTALQIISVAIAAEHAEFDRSEDESKLKLFFEHFINVFPKKSLWNERDLKAGAKYGLTTIKPLLTKEAKVAQILPMSYQVNPVMTEKKFSADESAEKASSLVRDIYGPHLKKTLDVVYGLRKGMKFEKDSHGASTIVEFEDAGIPMVARLTISVWNEKATESELYIYVNISRRKAKDANSKN
jgi:hypothetical protein